MKLKSIYPNYNRDKTLVRVDKGFTVDEVVFAEKGDLHLLGARSLEGLNLAVDARKKRLVAAGPLPVAEARG